MPAAVYITFTTTGQHTSQIYLNIFMVRMQVLDAKYSLDPKCTKLVIDSLMKEDRTIIFENYED